MYDFQSDFEIILRQKNYFLIHGKKGHFFTLDISICLTLSLKFIS